MVKRFGSLMAVNDISFSVREGELFAFLGPNGAGKSTTINILCTLLEKDAGEVEICGLKVGRDDQKIRSQIGVVFQENSLDSLLTVKQNLLSRAYLYETDSKRIKDNLDHVCSVLSIGELLYRPFGKLSGGQKRRCEIARAMMNMPKILFLDEPSTGLDPQTRQNVWECIEFLRREHNTSIFMTTHYMEEAANATQIAIIDEGKIVAFGAPHELKERYSTDTLRMVTRVPDHTRAILTEQKMTFQETDDLFTIPIESSLNGLELLKRFEQQLLSFEVLHGTMDDVFINITGKTLRED